MGGASKNADEDSFFNQKTPSTTEKRTLDKNSIMALYNQGGTNTSAAVPPMQNMFAAQGIRNPSNVSIFPFKKKIVHSQEYTQLLNQHSYPILQ